jgi:hypothetical protein
MTEEEQTKRRRRLAQRLAILDTLESLEELNDLLLEEGSEPRPIEIRGGRSDDA